MRPLELRLKGFRSYREETVFDWRGRHLVGVVGPIGAGKSSILDAVAFALYGKTPTFERDTKSLINQTASECHVELRFEVDGQVWKATRALRRKGASGHQLQRLADDEDGAGVLEPISGERPVRERVEQLLGMDFDAFCRSVLLAQNRFADFLKATPKERNEVLKGVFGYERFDAALDAAKRRVTAAQLLLDSLDREGSMLASARKQLEDAEERLHAATTRAESLEAAREPFEAAKVRGEEAGRRATEAEGSRSRLVEIAASVPTSEELDQVIEVASASAAVIELAADAAQRAEDVRVQAEATQTAVAERVGDQMAFAALVAKHEHLGAAAERAALEREGAAAAAHEAAEVVEQLVSRYDGAVAALAAADRALDLASSEASTADQALHAARHADMARSLRGTLAAGEPCPVCQQMVAKVPAVGRAPAISRAEQSLERARRAETAAGVAHRSATADVAATEERLGSARSRAAERERAIERADTALVEADAALAAVQSELVDRLGEGDPRALLDERTRELADAVAAAEHANGAAADARAALERARRLDEDGRSGLAALANRLASVWGSLGSTRDVVAEPAPLRAAFVEAGDALLESHERTASELAAAAEASEEASTTMRRLLEEAGLGADDDFTMAYATAAAERAAADEQVRLLRATVDAGADIDERLATAASDHALASRLVGDLQPSRFLAFLLEEERRALADLGSVHFEQLTGSAYRFTDDDRFEVLDMNAAGTERRADSLSGGETFLASLALALALAEMVARGGGRLDAFFLDEGFGSLDPEHLDRAMDGIGRLVANDPRRLVVLVSHVDQMRESLEDLIVLDKHDLSGDTVVVAGATLG